MSFSSNHTQIVKNYTPVIFAAETHVFESRISTPYEQRHSHVDYRLSRAQGAYTSKFWNGEESPRSLEELTREYKAEYARFLSPFETKEMERRQEDERQIRLDLYRARVPAWIADYANEMIESYERSVAEYAQPLTTLQENLVKALDFLRNVDKRKASRYSQNIDAHMVTLESGVNRLSLTATNGDSWIRTSVGARSGLPFKMAVNVKILYDLVHILPAEMINLSKCGDALHIESGPAKANLKGKTDNAQAMPALPEIEPITIFNSTHFKQEVARLVKITAKDDSHLVYTGVLLRFDENGLTLAAGDGYQVSDSKLEVSADMRGDWVVSRDNLNTLLSFLDDSALRIYINGDLVFFCQNEIVACFSAIARSFPAYEQVMPKYFEATAQVYASEIIAAIKSLKGIYGNTNRYSKSQCQSIRISLTPSQAYIPGTLTIKATSAEVGDRSVTIDANVDGQMLETPIDAGKLLAALENMIKTCPKPGKRASSVAMPQILFQLNHKAPWIVSLAGTDTKVVVMPMSDPDKVTVTA